MTVRTLGWTAAACVGAVVAIGAAQQALPQVGVSESAAREELLRGLDSGYVNYSGAAKAFRAVEGAARAQLAAGVIAWARAYTATPAFEQAYAAHRKQLMPVAPAFEGTPEEELATRLAKQEKEFEQNMANTRKAMEQLSAEQRKMMEEGLKAGAEAMKQMKSPEMQKLQLDGIRMQREAEAAEYTRELADWKVKYPESARGMIAARLKEFLAMSADVNFDAALESRDGKMRFVDPQYERKDGRWKLCYRAGRETVSAARAAADAWLKSLQ
jgi:hypothetical protein